MEIIGQAYQGLFVATVLLLAFLILISILRSVIGPRIADRIIAINMIGTMIIMIIAVLSVMLDQNYLVDICLIYAMISFLGVVVLCKIYTGVYLQKKGRKATLEAVIENIRIQQQNGCTRQYNDDTKQQGSSGSYAIKSYASKEESKAMPEESPDKTKAVSAQNQNEKEGA